MKHREFYHEVAETIFGMTEGEAYELERSLRGDPRFPKARSGPGGGPEVTPLSIAMFLLAALINGPRSEVVTKLHAYWNAQSQVCDAQGEDTPKFPWDAEILAPGPCELTGEASFGLAVHRILENDEYAGRVEAIRVNRSAVESSIEFAVPNETVSRTRFLDHRPRGLKRISDLRADGTLQSHAVVGGQAIQTLRGILRQDEIAKQTALQDALARVERYKGAVMRVRPRD